MKITLKDGSVKEYEKAMSVYDIAMDISEGLARAACCGKADGETVDLRTVIDRDRRRPGGAGDHSPHCLPCACGGGEELVPGGQTCHRPQHRHGILL